jgi:hypothetical protein
MLDGLSSDTHHVWGEIKPNLHLFSQRVTRRSVLGLHLSLMTVNGGQKGRLNGDGYVQC